MCVLERRKTKQQLHDTRFGLYERAVTFEGPEVYSTALPLRGEMLSGKLRMICQEVLDFTSKGGSGGAYSDTRMVLNLKVDNNERIWLLYSSSIRNVNSLERGFPLIGGISQKGIKEENALNVQNVIKFSPKTKLNQNANHDPEIKLSNEREFIYCPSCASVQSGETFHPVPYKTLITHFEQVMSLCNYKWPPPNDIINSAGGIGFGTVSRIGKSDDKMIIEDDCVIPPVIKYFHKRLRAEGYRRYRADPLFLHKQSNLCENCFLTYANLASSSFQIKVPINLDTELSKLNSTAMNADVSTKNIEKVTVGSKDKKNKKLTNVAMQLESFSSEILLPTPSLPTAIIEPPTDNKEEDLDQLMSLPYKTIESSNQPLKHLLDMYQAIEETQIHTDCDRLRKQSKTTVNPYKIPLTSLIETTNKRKKSKRKDSTEGSKRPNLSLSLRNSQCNQNDSACNKNIELLSNAMKSYDQSREAYK